MSYFIVWKLVVARLCQMSGLLRVWGRVSVSALGHARKNPDVWYEARCVTGLGFITRAWASCYCSMNVLSIFSDLGSNNSDLEIAAPTGN